MSWVLFMISVIVKNIRSIFGAVEQRIASWHVVHVDLSSCPVSPVRFISPSLARRRRLLNEMYNV